MKSEDINSTNYMLYRPETDFSCYPYILVSFIFFLSISEFIAPLFWRKLVPNFYDEQSFSRKGELKAGFTSTIHSSVVVTLCLYILITDTVLNNDPVWGDSNIIKTNMVIVVGYLVLDFMPIVLYYRESGDALFYYIHHFFSIFAFMYSMTYHACEFFSNVRLLAELSTPFVNNRRILEIMGHKTSKAYLFNGWLLALSFFICRIAVFPYYYGKIWDIYDTPAFESLGIIKFVLIGSSFILDCINIFWMYKICRGAVKVLRSKKKQDIANNKLQ